MKLLNFTLAATLVGALSCTPKYQGVVKDAETNSPISGVEVQIREDSTKVVTNENGEFEIECSNPNAKTLSWEAAGYMFEEKYNLKPSTNLNIQLRANKVSAAAARLESYREHGCEISNPEKPEWNIAFEQFDLKGDLAPDTAVTRRDPSAVIKVDGKYYVWYSYSLTFDEKKTAPWDFNDIYYATSTDGWNWKEEGIALARGEEGTYDHRSAFTTEIFVHEGKYYLVYQAAKDHAGIYTRNTVGIASSDSPDGPWVKESEPILHPTYTDNEYFDRSAVHDPCIIYYQNKFYLYYKGECSFSDKDGNMTWCDPVCGTDYGKYGMKQVKWGVAIADKPTGPYVKSDYNPITNTGHEISVWNYKDGVAILQHQDGPEGGTIQYSEDGVNFEIQGSVSNFPEAPGFYRPVSEATSPVTGASWGICHVLKWDVPGGWMHLKRFENVNKEYVVED